jgi:hypothetical protein
VIHNRAEFLRDERPRDRPAFSPDESLILGVNVGEILCGANRGVMERQLEVAIPVAGALVPARRCGIVGAGLQDSRQLNAIR